MGLFKKKSDPISDRARALNEQIAQLEEQIRELSAHQDEPPGPTAVSSPPPADAPPQSHSLAPSPDPEPASPPPPEPRRSSQTASPTRPKLRSTALPLGPDIPASTHPLWPAGRSKDALPASLKTNPCQAGPSAAATPPKDLGVRRSDWADSWRRLKNHFRGPATSNPKLVNYLAAGSIQGLRPLRYEKRVARNRFILLLTCLILVLWGIIALVLKRSP